MTIDQPDIADMKNQAKCSSCKRPFSGTLKRSSKVRVISGRGREAGQTVRRSVCRECVDLDLWLNSLALKFGGLITPATRMQIETGEEDQWLRDRIEDKKRVELMAQKTPADENYNLPHAPRQERRRGE